MNNTYENIGNNDINMQYNTQDIDNKNIAYHINARVGENGKSAVEQKPSCVALTQEEGTEKAGTDAVRQQTGIYTVCHDDKHVDPYLNAVEVQYPAGKQAFERNFSFIKIPWLGKKMAFTDDIGTCLFYPGTQNLLYLKEDLKEVLAVYPACTDENGEKQILLMCSKEINKAKLDELIEKKDTKGETKRSQIVPVDQLPDHIVLQLLLNSIENYDSGYRASILQGQCTYFRNEWALSLKGKPVSNPSAIRHRISGLELRFIDYEGQIILDQRIVSFVSSVIYNQTDLSKPHVFFKDGDRSKINIYAKYFCPDSRKPELVPWFEKAERGQQKNPLLYIKRQVAGTKASGIPFLGDLNPKKPKPNKVEAMHHALNQINQNYAGLVQVDFKQFPLAGYIDFDTEKKNDFKAHLAALMQKKTIALALDESDEKLSRYRNAFRDYLLNAKAPNDPFCKVVIDPENIHMVDVPEPGSLNLMFLHESDYYKANQLPDPYRQPDDLIVQHITDNMDLFSNQNKVNNSLIRNMLYQALIKADCKAAELHLPVWKGMDEKAEYEFILPAKKDEAEFKGIIIQGGKITKTRYQEASDDPHITEQFRLLKNFSDNHRVDHGFLRKDSQIAAIVATKYKGLPNLAKMNQIKKRILRRIPQIQGISGKA